MVRMLDDALNKDKPKLTEIANHASPFYKKHAEFANLFVNCAAAFRDLKTINESLQIFNSAHSQLPPYKILYRGKNALSINLFPIEMRKRIASISQQIEILRTYVLLQTDALITAIVPDTSAEVKFHNKISLAVSSAIFELKSKVTTFTLTLAELFVVGGVRSGLIKGLRVLSSELAEGLVFSLTERHELLGCQTPEGILSLERIQVWLERVLGGS